MPEPTPIVITDLRIPFIRLVLFFVKVALAAIPAAIILTIIFMVIAAIVAVAIGDNATWVFKRWSL